MSGLLRDIDALSRGAIKARLRDLLRRVQLMAVRMQMLEDRVQMLEQDRDKWRDLARIRQTTIDSLADNIKELSKDASK